MSRPHRRRPYKPLAPGASRKRGMPPAQVQPKNMVGLAESQAASPSIGYRAEEGVKR